MGDGSITAKELTEILRQMGHNPTQETVNGMMAEADSNGDGTISLEEFSEMMRNKEKANREEAEIWEAFHSFDLDGNGYITRDELESVLKKMGQKLTSIQVEDMLRQADLDGDGKIT